MESADTQTGGERGSCRRGNRWEKFGALFAQRASDCQKTLLRGSEGRGPPSCIPNPATCAVDSEALRSKVSLRVSPAALKAQGKRVLSEKIAAGELFRQAVRGSFPEETAHLSAARPVFVHLLRRF